MSNSKEEDAGKLLICAYRITKGHITLELILKFRSLCNDHVLDHLAPADHDVVREAAEIIFLKHGVKILPSSPLPLKSRIG